MGFRGGVKLTPPQHILVFKYLSRDRVKKKKSTPQKTTKLATTKVYIEIFGNMTKRIKNCHFLQGEAPPSSESLALYCYLNP